MVSIIRRNLLLVALVSALPILLEIVYPLGPRWPSPYGNAILLAIVNSISVLALPSVVRSVARSVPFAPTVVTFVCLGSFFLLLLFYVYLDFSLCYVVPPLPGDANSGVSYRDRIVGGGNDGFTAFARQELANTPTTIVQLLSDNEFKSDGIWTDTSVLQSHYRLISMWFAAWLLGGAALANAAVFSPASAPSRSAWWNWFNFPRNRLWDMQEAILSGFRRDALQILLLGIGHDLEQIVEPGNLRKQVFQLLEVAQSEGWLTTLLEAAAQELPDNPRIQAAYRQVRSDQ